MNDDRKIAYLIAAAETANEEVKDSTQQLKDAIEKCSLITGQIKSSVVSELEKRLLLGTQEFLAGVKKEQQENFDLSKKLALKVVAISAAVGLVIAAIVFAYSYYTVSKLKTVREEIERLEPEYERLTAAGFRQVEMHGAKIAIQAPGRKWEIMQAEDGNTYFFKR